MYQKLRPEKLTFCVSGKPTDVQDWTQLQILQILLPQRFFGTLCLNLQFYANQPASAGLRILQNLRFFANFTIFQ